MISSRDEGALSETAAEMREATGAEVYHHAADLTRPEDVRAALIGATVERFGGVDALVNNSGGPPGGGFEDFADDGWQGAFELKRWGEVEDIAQLATFLASDESSYIHGDLVRVDGARR